MQYELRINQNDLLEGLKRFAPRNDRELRKLQKHSPKSAASSWCCWVSMGSFSASKHWIA